MKGFSSISQLSSEKGEPTPARVWLAVAWLVLATIVGLAADVVAFAKNNNTPNPPAPGQTLYNVADFPGAMAGDKITACMAALAPSGGVCDARSLVPPLSIPSGLDIPKHATIIFGYGTIELGATINIHDTTSVGIIGQGADPYGVSGTAFVWAGPPNEPAFKFSSVNRSRLEHVTIEVAASNPLMAGVWFETDALNISVPGSNKLDDVFIDSAWASGSLDKGVVLALGPGGDANGDYNEFDSVQVRGYATAGFSIEAGQAKMQRFTRCMANGQGIGKYGITTALGQPGTGGGSFQWNGGGFTSNTEADIYLGYLDDTILVNGGYSEHSARFLTTYGATSTAWPVTITSFTWNGDRLAADGNMIVFTQQGGLTLIGNTLGFPGQPARVLATCSGHSAVVAIGNRVMSTLAQPFATSTTATKWVLLGNMISTDPSGGNAMPLPNVVP